MMHFFSNILKLFKEEIYREEVFEEIKNQEKILWKLIFYNCLFISTFIGIPATFIGMIMTSYPNFLTFLLLNIIALNVMFLGSFLFNSFLLYCLCKLSNGEITYKTICNLYLQIFGWKIFAIIIILIPFIGQLLFLELTIYLYYCFIKGTAYISKCNISKFLISFILIKLATSISYYFLMMIIVLRYFFAFN